MNTYSVAFVPRKPAGEIYSVNDALKAGGWILQSNLDAEKALSIADRRNATTYAKELQPTGCYIRVFQ